MKKTFQLLMFVSVSLLWACDKNENDNVSLNDEYGFVRLLVSDELSNSIQLIEPKSGEIHNFQAKYEKSRLYPMSSGRFVAVIHRDKNFTETFDSGLEFHSDHVDVRGTPKFGKLAYESIKPTHFKTKAGEFMTFNDGDGSLNLAKENEIHSEAAQIVKIYGSSVPHHGAMTFFSNGNIAITHKTGEITGTLPERVSVIDRNGKELHASTITTGGIHGNASDDKNAVFGSASGILVVKESGGQKLISYPADFGTAWFGTILETRLPQKFIGYTAAKGAYLIDIQSDKITPIVEATDIMVCKTSMNNQKLIVLRYSGNLEVFDISSNKQIANREVIATTTKEEVQKPTIVATEKFAYITQPKNKEILKISLLDFSSKRFKTAGVPYSLTLFGYEFDEPGRD